MAPTFKFRRPWTSVLVSVDRREESLNKADHPFYRSMSISSDSISESGDRRPLRGTFQVKIHLRKLMGAE